MLPPRATWHDYRPRRRHGMDSATVSYIALLNATLAMRDRYPDEPWAKRLAIFIQKTREKALTDKTFQFAPYQIFAQQKVGKPEFRPIVAFNLQDTIISSLTARYLTNRFDPFLDDSSFAFRCPRPGERKAPNHHDAFAEVKSARYSYGEQGLFVAEADIKGFFDCLDHGVIRKCFDKLEGEAKRAGRPISHRAKIILEALLRCYNFKDCVRNRSEELLPHATDGIFPWPEVDLRKLNPRFEDSVIGVPQGGALSMVIANIVLHQADAMLRMLPNREEFTYIRYCDDMLILSQDREVCTNAFNLYLSTLKDLRLPVHAPMVPPPYLGDGKRAFWNAKSKYPYCWGGEIDQGDFPWIGFVGYQLRWDGLARIRPSTIKKHVQRLGEIQHNFLHLIHRLHSDQGGVQKLSEQAEAIILRLRFTLNSLSVGRLRLSSEVPGERFWCNGFRAIKGLKIVGHQIKGLDRYREAVIRRVWREMRKLIGAASPVPHSDRRWLRYYGYPFSYYACFKRAKKGANPKP